MRETRGVKATQTLTYQGKTRTIIEWEKVTGINRAVLRYRKRHGWKDSKTLLTPIMPRNKPDIKKQLSRKVKTRSDDFKGVDPELKKIMESGNVEAFLNYKKD